MRLAWACAAALFAGLTILPAAAQQPATAVATPAAPATPAPTSITIRAGTGTMVPLSQPAATVIAADPNIARVQPASPTSLFVIGVGIGQTNVVATSASGGVVANYAVTVLPGATPPKPSVTGPEAAPAGPAPPKLPDPRAVAAAIHQIVPGAQNVKVAAIGNKLDITGYLQDAGVADRVIAIANGFAGNGNIVNDLNLLSSVQVNLRVRVAEIDRQITRELGINWQAIGQQGNFRFGLFTGAAVSGAVSALAPISNSFLPVPPFSVGAGYQSGGWNVNAVIDALAQDQLVTILAEPNLTALSGQTASFLAGGEFPVPVPQSSNGGGTTITIEYKQYGVSLAFVPTVLGPNLINLKVAPEVSQLSTQGAISVPVGNGTLTVPALTVRRAQTTVELGSGQSFAIGGLLEHSTTQALQSLPGIGEIPVLGALFRSTAFQRGETELVIIVTPYLVKPAASPAMLAAPTDGFHPATDLDRFLFGHTLATGPGEHPVPAGFSVE